MGIIQNSAIKTSVISYFGLIFGYLNKGLLFVMFLSTEEIGLINLILPIGLLLAQFSNFNSANIIWRFFPFFRNHEMKHFGFLSLNLLLVTLGSLLFSLLFYIFEGPISMFYSQKSPEFIEYYYWILIVAIPTAFYFTFDYYLRAMYKNVLSVFLKDIVLRLLTPVFIVLYALEIISFDLLVHFICLSYMLPMVVLGFYLKKLNEWSTSYKKINIHRRFLKVMWSFSMYSYFNMMGALLVVTLDVVMISSYIGLAANGVYSTILYLTSALLVPYRTLLRVTAPLISEYWKKSDVSSINIVYKKVSSISLVIGVFGFLIVWINREELFQLLPNSFADGIYIFFFLMIGKVIDAYFGLNGTILVTSKKFRYDIIFTTFLVVLVILLNMLFIPIWGVIGAALSTSIAYVMYNLLRMSFIWYHYNLKPFKIHQIKLLVLGTATFLVFYFIPFNYFSLWTNLILRSIIFCLIFGSIFYYYKIEPEIVGYLDKEINAIKKRFIKK